jgi:hypothetical protein
VLYASQHVRFAFWLSRPIFERDVWPHCATSTGLPLPLVGRLEGLPWKALHPCHRIWVLLILDFLASGMSVDEVLVEYPGLNRDDILACIAYGAEMSRERYVEIPVETSR